MEIQAYILVYSSDFYFCVSKGPTCRSVGPLNVMTDLREPERLGVFHAECSEREGRGFLGNRVLTYPHKVLLPAAAGGDGTATTAAVAAPRCSSRLRPQKVSRRRHQTAAVFPPPSGALRK